MKKLFLIITLFTSVNFAQSELPILFSDEVFNPLDISGLQAWYESSGIVGTTTVTGWSDISGNNRHLTVAGSVGGSLTRDTDALNGYDGVKHSTNSDQERLVDTTTITAPLTIYAVIKQITWINGTAAWDGGALRTMLLYGVTSTPRISMRVSGTLVPQTDDLAVNTFGIVTCVYNSNGQTSSIQVNDGTATTATTLATVNLTALTLLGSPGVLSGNVSIVEFLLYTGVHDATNKAKVKQYLNKKYSIY